MSAIDIISKLEKCESDRIGTVQRILMVTDGTVTEILEAAFCERIRLIKIDQGIVSANSSHIALEPREGEQLLKRQILLQGSDSGKNYAYAESYIAIERLESSFCDKLIKSQTPLCRLWLEYKLETFKELLDVRLRSTDSLCGYFGCAEEALLLDRTYRVFSGRRAVMMITECFPATYEALTSLSSADCMLAGKSA